MMVAEIIGGFWFGSVALIADGLHMSTHAGALLIAALAYTYSRRYAGDERFVFGTGKLGDLAAFTSAIALGMTHIRSMTLLPPVKCGRIVSAMANSLPNAPMRLPTLAKATMCGRRRQVAS
jgi:hypothetical protein